MNLSVSINISRLALSLAFLLSIGHSMAIEISKASLPLEYRCRQTAVTGFRLDGINNKWTPVVQKNESMSFILQIYSFSKKVTHPKCEVAILAAGKLEDKYSKFKRDVQEDVCVIIELNQPEKYGLIGPIIRYCSVVGPSSSRLICQEPPNSFAFDSRTLSYIENESLGIVFDTVGALVYAGACSRN